MRDPLFRGTFHVARDTAFVLSVVAAVSLFAPSAWAQQPIGSPPAATPPPAPLPLETEVIEVPYQQTITVSAPGATRVLSVNPNVVEATLRSPGVIELRAPAFGQTFLHVWSPQGRLTRLLKVVQPPPPRPTLGEQHRSAEAIAKHLTFEYENRYRTFRRGPALARTGLHTTNQMTHDLTGHMATPHGELSGRVLFQRVDNLHKLSTWNASLINGDVGPLKHFDVLVGDTSVGFSDLTLPSAGIRGTLLRYYDLEPYRTEVFYGRQRGFFFTLPTLSNVTGLERDLFFSGARIQDLERPWTWEVAYAGASGSDRSESQTSQAMETESWYWFGDRLGVGAQAGRNQEDAYGYRVKSALRGRVLNVDATYRNISQRYENLLGRSAEQGERGLLLDARFVPRSAWRFHERLDVYRDTLFDNPAEPGLFNLEADTDAVIELTRRTVWDLRYSRHRLPGRLFPTDTTSWGTGLRQRLGAFPLVGNGTIFSDYLFRKVRSVSAPSSDFESHTINVGIGAPLTDSLYWQVSQQWTLLNETSTGLRSIPRQTTVGVNYARQFTRLPMSVRAGFNFSTSSRASSPNSFLVDEDRFVWDAGLRYHLSPETEAFVDGRLLRRQRLLREYEVEIETGVRYLFDTGIAWEPSATLSGFVFQDLNADGERQAEERGLPRVTVRGMGDRAAVTDAEGRFFLGRVRGQRTEVSVDVATIPAGYVPTSPTKRDIDITHPPQAPLAFGFIAQAELRVRVFLDTNGDRHYDATDVPLADIHLSLDDGTTVSTDRSGWAFFRALSPGTYTVTLQVGDLAAGYVPMTEVSRTQTLAIGAAVPVDFPMAAQRSIGGRVYVDWNRDGRWDHEPALDGVWVCLDGTRRVKTLEDGRYLFKDVSAGVHRVRLNCGAPLPQYLPLNATLQVVEVSPQPIQLDHVDFRLGEQAAIMQDVVADVVRQRRQREQLIEEMVRERRAQQQSSR